MAVAILLFLAMQDSPSAAYSSIWDAPDGLPVSGLEDRADKTSTR
jgi:hypothetical protein